MRSNQLYALVAIIGLSAGCDTTFDPSKLEQASTLLSKRSHDDPSRHRQPRAPISCEPTALSPLCTMRERDLVTPSDTAQFTSRLIGTWRQCGAQSLLGTGESGLEFEAGGTWHKLFSDGRGSLLRGAASDSHGVWDVTDTSPMNGPGHFQVDLRTGQGSLPVVPAFADSPRTMRIHDRYGRPVDYVMDNGVVPPVVEPEQVELHYPAEECAGVPVDLSHFDSERDARAALIGRWSTCFGSAFGTTEEVGIEFAADGTWRKLFPLTTDTVTREYGFGREGTWSLFDMSSYNGPGTFALQMVIAGHGRIDSNLMLSTSPRRLNLTDYNAPESVGFYTIAP